MGRQKRNRTKFPGVYSIGKGAYVLRVTCQDPLTKKISEREKTFRSGSLLEAEKERLDLYKSLKSQVENGRNAQSILSQVTYSDFLEHYFAEVESEGNRRKGSIQIDRETFAVMVTPIIGQIKMCSMNRSHLTYWRDSVQKLRKKDGSLYALNTYKKAWRVVRATLRYAHRESIIDLDITSNIRMTFSIGIEAKQRIALTPEECSKMIDAVSAESLQIRGMVILGMIFGLRLGEISSLGFDSLDFESGEIRIERSFSNGFLEEGTKNGEINVLPMLPEIRSILERIQEEQSGKHNPNNLVFPSKRSRSYIRAGYFNQQLARICEKAGIRKITAHDLRRTANTILFANNVSPELIRGVLNHKSSAMSEHYLIVNQELTGSILSNVWQDILDKL